MVKLKGPMMSLDASGKLAGAIVFSKWKGRNYARALVTPSNPQSGGQTGMRMMLRYLSQYWADLSTAKQDTWNDLADQKVVSQFNAYVGFNLAKWRNFLAPMEQSTGDRSGAGATIANFAATAGVRQVTLDWDSTVELQGQCVLLFRSTDTGFDSGFTNLVQAVYTKEVDSYSWVDTPLAAGTYYYQLRSCSSSGLLGTEDGEINATVT